MASNNTNVTTTKSVTDNQSLIVGSSVTNLRIGMARNEKLLLDLNVILLNYRVNEDIIKARILNNNLEIEEQLSGARTYANPINSFSMAGTEPNPHKQISAEQFNALHRSYGTPELLSTLNGIDKDIKATETLIKKLKNEFESFKAQLAEAEAKYKNPIGFLKGILPPTAVDLEKDAIQKSRLSNLSLLYQLSLSFKSLSTDANGRAAYSDDPAMAQILMKVKNTFWAHAQQFPEYIEPNGLKTLIFDNPGDPWNISILKTDRGTLRIAGVSDKADAVAAEYVKAMTVIKNNTNLSKNLSTKPEAPLKPGESLNYKTRTFSATSTSMGVSYKGSFEMPDLLSSVKKWWKNKNKDLMVGLPICPNVPKPIQTSTDTSPVRQAQEFANEEIKVKGQNAFNEAMARAGSQQEKINKSSEIPNDSPQWVRLFSNIYGEAEIGSIKFQGSDYYVTRVVSDSLDPAKESSKLIIDPISQIGTMSQIYNDIAQYAYNAEGVNETSKAKTGALDVDGEYIYANRIIYYTLWKVKEEPTEALPKDLTEQQLLIVAKLDEQIASLEQKIAQKEASLLGPLAPDILKKGQAELDLLKRMLKISLDKKFGIVNGIPG